MGTFITEIGKRIERVQTNLDRLRLKFDYQNDHNDVQGQISTGRLIARSVETLDALTKLKKKLERMR